MRARQIIIDEAEKALRGVADQLSAALSLPPFADELVDLCRPDIAAMADTLIPDEPPAVKKLPIEWATEQGYVINDPDGWRDDGKSIHEPIGQEEFHCRFGSSSVGPLTSFVSQVLFDEALKRSPLDDAKADVLRAIARKHRPRYEDELARAERTPPPGGAGEAKAR